MDNQSADRLWFMLSGGAGQSVRPFKSIRTLNSHFPILTSPRSSNGHSPVPSSEHSDRFGTEEFRIQQSEGTSSLPATARLRIATRWLRLDERAKHLGPPILKIRVSLESAF